MELTADQLEIRGMARQVAEGELRPHAARWDADARLDDAVFETLAELGFLGPRIPEAYGGLELDAVTWAAILEEVAWGDASVALSLAIHSGPVVDLLLRDGSDAQRERWLPALAAGEALGAFALSEPEAGSDAASVGCEARRGDGGWTLRGTKAWVTNGDRAGVVLVFARSEGSPGDAEGIGCFLVERDAPGYAVVGRTTTMGLRASESVTVELDGTPAEPVGDPAGAFASAMRAIDVGRVGVAAQAVGVARAAMEHAVRYSHEREQFGRAIRDFGAVQEKLATMAARTAAARALTLRAAAALPGPGESAARRFGPDGVTARAAIAKLTASEAAMWVADEAVQLFGGYGYMRDYPVEKLMRDAKGTEIYEGTSEILRHVIAREVLREGVEDGAPASSA